jgi:DNA-nicking Smr family endonuclease
VITGKGRDEPDEPGPIPTRRRGVLRQAVPRWLAEPPLADLVLGVGPAGPGHGGNGALYVLLRRAKPRGAGR